jgi:hypothetical protein
MNEEAEMRTTLEIEALARARDRYLLQLKQINDILHPEVEPDGQPFYAVPLFGAPDGRQCAFCHRWAAEVEQLITTGRVCICDECVRACLAILAPDEE